MDCGIVQTFTDEKLKESFHLTLRSQLQMKDQRLCWCVLPLWQGRPSWVRRQSISWQYVAPGDGEYPTSPYWVSEVPPAVWGAKPSRRFSQNYWLVLCGNIPVPSSPSQLLAEQWKLVHRKIKYNFNSSKADEAACWPELMFPARSVLGNISAAFASNQWPWTELCQSKQP